MKTLIALLVLATAIPVARAEDCKPFVTHTCVVKTQTECRWAKDACGHRYSYEVRVTTYRSYLSNGQTTIFTRTARIS